MPMNDVLRKMVEDYIHNRMPEYLQTLYDVITIPSPTGEEDRKAQWILEQLEAMGAEGAYRDEAGNVIYPYCIEGVDKFPLSPPIWIRCLREWTGSLRTSTGTS